MCGIQLKYKDKVEKERSLERVAWEAVLSDKPEVLADELNQFYFSLYGVPENSIIIDEEKVLKSLRHAKERKSPSTNGTGARLLKNCARFFFIYSSVHFFREKVPKKWKNSIVVPVAKVRTPKSQNDYCPVSLTSL